MVIMKFERKDGALIDPIGAGFLEVELSKKFGQQVSIDEKGEYFDINIRKCGTSKEKVVSVLDKLGYKSYKSR